VDFIFVWVGVTILILPSMRESASRTNCEGSLDRCGQWSTDLYFRELRNEQAVVDEAVWGSRTASMVNP